MRIRFFTPVQVIEAPPKHKEESIEDVSDTTSTLSEGSCSSDGSLDAHLSLEFNEDGTPLPAFSLDQDNALNKFFSSPLEPDMVMDFWTAHIIARCWSMLDARPELLLQFQAKLASSDTFSRCLWGLATPLLREHRSATTPIIILNKSHFALGRAFEPTQVCPIY